MLSPPTDDWSRWKTNGYANGQARGEVDGRRAMLLHLSNRQKFGPHLSSPLGESPVSLTNPLSLRRQPIDFEIHGHCYQLVRIRDHQLRKWIGNVLCIDEFDYTHQFSLFEYWLMQRDKYLGFPQLYVTLKSLSGESSIRFDPWKSSFRFPFGLKIFKTPQTVSYLLDIHNHRRAYYFRFYKKLHHTERNADYDRTTVYSPFEQEFSSAEMDEVLIYFYSYLVGYFDILQAHYNKPFIQQVESDCLVFGYQHGEFFAECYSNLEKFTRIVAERTELVRQDLAQRRRHRQRPTGSRGNPPEIPIWSR